LRRARSATASAPSTTANLGSGFDVFGMALDAFRDTVTVSASDSRGVRVVADGGVPAGARSNTAGLVALAAMRMAGKTAASRGVVPRRPRLEDATANVSNAAALVAGMARGDTALVGSAMADAIAEPARRASVPWLEAARRRAVRAGAAGVAISGAGPSIVAVAPAGADIGAIGEAMRRGLAASRVRCRIVECRPTARGAAGA